MKGRYLSTAGKMKARYLFTTSPLRWMFNINLPQHWNCEIKGQYLSTAGGMKGLYISTAGKVKGSVFIYERVRKVPGAG